MRPLWKIQSLIARVERRVLGGPNDYRAILFEELVTRLDGRRPLRILEIGPRDGEDTRRLVTLGPEAIILVELPDKKGRIDEWLPALDGHPIELIYGNIMYDPAFGLMEPFDVVWCTGVLYHNPEQLRFVRQMFDLTKPGGLLVLESATARRRATRNQNCVELWYPPSKDSARDYHLSANISHLPSLKAMASWLRMIGFTEIELSACHRRVNRMLGKTRAAFVARRSPDATPDVYYRGSDTDFPIGRAR